MKKRTSHSGRGTEDVGTSQNGHRASSVNDDIGGDRHGEGICQRMCLIFRFQIPSSCRDSAAANNSPRLVLGPGAREE